jgi:putative transposase
MYRGPSDEETGVGRKGKHSDGQIIDKLREADVALAQGRAVKDNCRQLEVTEQTYYHWRKEVGGLKVDPAKQLRDRERENVLLQRIVSDQALDVSILREAASGRF